EAAKEAMRLASYKMPVKTRFVARDIPVVAGETEVEEAE
ncbi:50S ribosomal protein L16, partial [Dehalococcoides mccartyi]